MKRYILDTNIFFNMQAGINLGTKTETVVKKITQLIKKNKDKEFYMPPSAVDEFLSFFEDKNQEFLKEFLSVIIIKSPDYNKINFSANVFYKIIEEVRKRAYRGLNIAEEEVFNAGKLMLKEKKLSHQEFQIKVGEVIKKLRERYRKATRLGFLDSPTDLDLIVLAKEIDGFLVSTDEGVIRWARDFGVKELPAMVFVKQL
ncbi:MAG: RNA ligase partner protein [Microgenomates group bacterium]